MLVLVTRPRAQADVTAAALERLGHAALIDPAIEIVPLPLPPLDPAEAAAVIRTSANTATSLPRDLCRLPLFAVGPATAKAARSRGARQVHVGTADGRALAALVARTLAPSAGTLLHLGAAEPRPGLAEALQAAGYGLRHVPAYQSVPSRGLAAATGEALRTRQLAAALFFSPRSAAVWRGLVEAAGLSRTLDGLDAVCISAAAAEALAGLPFRSVRVADRPDEAAMLRCLDAPGVG